MTKNVTGREAHYDGDIFALDVDCTAVEAIRRFKKNLAADYREKVSRRTAPQSGEAIPVREYYDGNSDPSDWFEVIVP